MLCCCFALRQLRTAAQLTGFELVTVGIGLVKCRAAINNVSALHRPGLLVVPVDTGLQDHRLVVHTHSTGGPVRDAMETECAIAGFKGDDIPHDVKSVRSANQSLSAIWHQVCCTLGKPGCWWL